MVEAAVINRKSELSNLSSSQKREWLAQLALKFAVKQQRTTLVHNKHLGPLCVQRPFYPEVLPKTSSDQNNCCHIYLLHPPGGLAAGDRIDIDLALDNNSHTLITTPSAGKVYGTDVHGHSQQQHVHADIQTQACLEWLPQETIAFTGANAQLVNRFKLHGDAQLIGWDMVCLGRRASDEIFDSGRCEQLIEIERDDELLFRERNIWPGNSEMLQAAWGMAGHVVSGTFFAALNKKPNQSKSDRDNGFTRRQVDQWREQLQALNIPGEWGITQKPGIFLARYLGQSAQHCRQGFEMLWQSVRPEMINKPAVRPRIWNT